MNHTDHVNLIRSGIPGSGGIWADFGSGGGAFTLALAELVGPDATIYSVDQNAGALKRQQQVMQARFPHHTVQYVTADFTQRLDLPPLDGIVMANALHFVRRKDRVIRLLRDYLAPGGRLIVVEYDTDHGNRWVPYPFAYSTWESLAARNGFGQTTQIATCPSSFLGRFYAALSLVDNLSENRPHP
jgi:ubiquinone/menaquinone biosynthesis C-methylase UbiE